MQHLLLHIKTIVIKLPPSQHTERNDTELLLIDSKHQLAVAGNGYLILRPNFVTLTRACTSIREHPVKWAIYIGSPSLNTSDVTHKPRSDAQCLSYQASVFREGHEMSGLRIRTRTTHLHCQSDTGLGCGQQHLGHDNQPTRQNIEWAQQIRGTNRMTATSGVT